jgi:FixJ family two-component response regulator
MMIENTFGNATTRQTVHVVDDDSNTRDALFQLLTVAGYSVKLYASGPEFLKAYDGLPGCVTLDLAMPEMRGEVLLDEIVHLKLNVVVLIMTGHATIESAIQITRAGAMGLLQKPFNNDELLKNVEDIFHKARSVFARRALVDDYRKQLNSLTAREREVFDLMAADMTSQEIAAHLGNSKKTIDIHRTRVMQKMGARTISELIMGWTLLFCDHSPKNY